MVAKGKKDFLDINRNIKFDIIFDSLCMHEQPKETWTKYLDIVFETLKKNGSFICRHGVSTSETSFEEDHLLFIQEDGTLLKQKNSQVIISNYLPKASLIEKTLLDKGFKIDFFSVSSSHKLILHRNSSIPRSTDPDLLEFVATKI